ncbi:anti-sigma-V factor RsiV [Clostridium sediminicola]|uniref:DUF3298 and DUF4163 domain-containing protein n=1 Tax=Clostridium sediminicola TaxID=3114879 RepID=UPI0031F1FC4A
MDQKFNEIRKEYKSIEIPKELDDIVNKTIEKADNERKNNKGNNKNIKKAVVAAGLAFSIFLVGVNTSEAFAESMSKIPVLGSIAKVFTFVEKEAKNDTLEENIKAPAIKGLSDEELQTRINDEINKKVQEGLKAAEERAAEYKTAFLETGGKEEDYNPIEINVDYEIKSSNDKILSFTVFQNETLAAAYAETHYYNIDLVNNKELELKDLLGDSYKEKINESVAKQVEELKKNSDNSFWDEEMDFGEIFENQNYFVNDDGKTEALSDSKNFYINEEGKAVVIFKKYEIAPGYMGPLEFVIE